MAKFKQTDIDGVVLIEPDVHHDSRGCFFELWTRTQFQANGIDRDFIQDNCSVSSKGVLRGLHFQTAPCAQAKLVYCTTGSVFDVAVDLRANSPTYLKYISVELSDGNRRILFIPEGFAHGFLALSDCRLQYKVSAGYSPTLENGIRFNDPAIGIRWPFAPTIVSPKDLAYPLIED